MSNYKKIASRFIEDINSEVTIYEHNKTKALVCAISNDDNNKVFSIAFKTPPKDNTGVCHILEHSVLCGSRKYDVKDPFIELVKGSINTFLNAITFPDKTIYPGASTNEKDFKNIMDVYLDAVFYPNIYKHKEIFFQEGWHYEIFDENDELSYNGVVYNEMKGAYSEPLQALVGLIMKSLFKDTAYKYDSGGLPGEIPNLTYEDFLNYHKTYYHPSNAIIYLYGNCDMSERLDYLDTNYLSKFSYQEIDSQVKFQEPYVKPVTLKEKYQVLSKDELENKTFITYNVVLKDKSVEDILGLSLILAVLFKIPGAKITKLIIDNKLCEDVTVSLTQDMLQPVISILLSNSNEGNLAKAIELIDSALKEVIDSGLDYKALENILDYNEFKLREALFEDTPRGLDIILSSLSTMLYDKYDPFSSLDLLKCYKSLRSKFNTSYYTDLISNNIINNNHKSYVVLVPTLDNLAKGEASKLKDIKASLSKKELEDLIELNQNLAIYEMTKDTKEGLASIPKLKKEDLSYSEERLNLEVIKDTSYPLTFSNYHTNNISYLSFIFNLKNLGLNDLVYTKLLTKLLTKISTKSLNYNELTKAILAKTGGLSFSLLAITKEDNSYFPALFINLSAKEDKLKEALELTKEITFNTLFIDTKRIKELLTELKVDLSYSISDSANTLSLTRAMSYIDEASYLKEQTGGLSFYYFVKDLCDNFEVKEKEVISNLSHVYNIIFNKKYFRAHLTNDNLNSISLIDNFYEALQENDYKSSFTFTPNKLNEGFMTNYNVNYVARVGKCKKVTTGAIAVLNQIINYDYLWNKVRVEGGAYGVSLALLRKEFICFTSYRDPNIKKTYEAYAKVLDYILSLDKTKEELLSYKIGVIGLRDMPLHVKDKGSKAILNYLKDLSYDVLLKERKEIIDTSLEKLKSLASYFKEALETNALCAIGNKNKILEEKDLFKEIKDLN